MSVREDFDLVAVTCDAIRKRPEATNAQLVVDVVEAVPDDAYWDVMSQALIDYVANMRDFLHRQVNENVS